MIVSPAGSEGEYVIVIHGICSGRIVMWPLARRLRRLGYRVEQWSYPSAFTSISSHAARFRDFILQKTCTEPTVHIVAHSMGCIVVRAALNQHGDRFDPSETSDACPDPSGLDLIQRTHLTDRHGKLRISNIGRIVFLAPPNSGSFAARICSYGLGWLMPPTRELSDVPSSYVNRLPSSLDHDFGVIAARYDVLVALPSTHLGNERSHVSVNATHNSMLFSNRVCRKIVAFLQRGNFEECSPPLS